MTDDSTCQKEIPWGLRGLKHFIIPHHIILFSLGRVVHINQSEQLYITNKRLAWVVSKMDNAIYHIIHYPVESMVCFVNTCPLDSDLSGGYRYPAFEHPGPEL